MTILAPSSGTTTTAPLPRLRPARFDDFAQIQSLESSHGLLTLPEETWRGIWLDNPLAKRLGPGWPIGWVLEQADGRLVGSLANIPTLYALGRRELVAATGRAWVVTPEYRGIALWLMDEYFNQEGVDLFINTTVNGLAVDAFSAFGSSRVPVGDWETASFCVTGYRGFAAVALRIKRVPMPGLLAYPLAVVLKGKDIVTGRRRPPGQTCDIEIANDFDARFDEFWAVLRQENPDRLLAVRDRATLSWHFGRGLREGQARVFTASRNGLLRAYCILKRQDHPPSGLIRMRLVDYQSLEPDDRFLPRLIGAAHEHCVAGRIHTLEHVGLDLPKTRCFDRFAPYRRKLPAWPFYYKAADADIEARLRNPLAWDPSSFDGDASL